MSETPVLAKVLPIPETHEPRRRPRAYLAASDLTDQLARALSGTMPDPRPLPHKVVVERTRYVPRVPQAEEA